MVYSNILTVIKDVPQGRILFSGNWVVGIKRMEPLENRVLCTAAVEKASWRECHFYQGLNIGYKAGVVRKFGAEDASRGCGTCKSDMWWSTPVTFPYTPLPHDTPTVLPLKSPLRHSLPLCFQSEVVIPSNALCPHSPSQPASQSPLTHPTFIEHLLHLGHFTRDLETQSWKYIILDLKEHSGHFQAKVIFSVT